MTDSAFYLFFNLSTTRRIVALTQTPNRPSQTIYTHLLKQMSTPPSTATSAKRPASPSAAEEGSSAKRARENNEEIKNDATTTEINGNGNGTAENKDATDRAATDGAQDGQKDGTESKGDTGEKTTAAQGDKKMEDVVMER